MDSSKLGSRLLIAAILASLAVVAATLFREASYYPYIVIDTPDALRATFLHQGRVQKQQCESDVQRLAEAIRSKCDVCKILEHRCLDKLEPQQRRMIEASPLDLPSARLPDGIVTFGSQDPFAALTACRESERQSAMGPGGSIVECHSPGSTSSSRAIPETGWLRNLGVAALVSLCLTISLVLLLAGPAAKVGLVDVPNERKHHEGHVPLIGGLAMCLAFMLTAMAVVNETPRPLFLSVIVLGIIGLLDDLKELSARSKLFAQILAVVLMATWAGVQVRNLGDLFATGPIDLASIAIPFTIFGVVGVINATNMIDGLDGLAGGISLTASLCLMLAAYLCGATTQAALLAILSAGIIGFLIFNLSHPWHGRASVFMGDTGSLFLGFVLAWFAVDLSQSPGKPLYPISAVWILGLPLLDTVSLMLRRMLRGVSPFSADRQHVHHILLAANIPQSTVVTLLVATSAFFGGVGLAGWYFSVPEYVLFYSYVALFLAYYLTMHKAWKVTKFLKAI